MGLSGRQRGRVATVLLPQGTQGAYPVPAPPPRGPEVASPGGLPEAAPTAWNDRIHDVEPAGFCWAAMGCRSPGAPTGLRFLTQRVHHRAGKGASWSTHPVLGRLRKSFVCLR